MREALQELLIECQFSPLYKTAPVGVSDSHEYYYNQLALGLWEGSAESLLDATESIEKQLGRSNKGKLKPRVADIDILLFRSEIIKTSRLTIPHHALLERRFHIEGLKALVPSWTVPGSQELFSHYQMSPMVQKQEVEILL